MIYDLPFGRGKTFLGGANSKINSVIGGWQAGMIFSYYSGQFLTPVWEGRDTTGTSHTTSSTPPTVTRRPDLLHNPNLPPSQRTIDRWFDPTAFGPPQPGSFGTSSKGVIEGPNAKVFHAGLFKHFSFREKMQLRVELTATNIFNHVNLGEPGLNISELDSVGIIGGTGIEGNLDQSGARSFRAGLRLEW